MAIASDSHADRIHPSRSERDLWSSHRLEWHESCGAPQEALRIIVLVLGASYGDGRFGEAEAVRRRSGYARGYIRHSLLALGFFRHTRCSRHSLSDRQTIVHLTRSDKRRDRATWGAIELQRRARVCRQFVPAPLQFRSASRVQGMDTAMLAEQGTACASRPLRVESMQVSQRRPQCSTYAPTCLCRLSTQLSCQPVRRKAL